MVIPLLSNRQYNCINKQYSTVDSYDALMLRLHYQTPNQLNRDEAEVGQTLWLTTDVARQFISILEAGIAKIESGDYQENEYKRH
ncbi:biofilm formation regulator BssS [Enterobacter cloacae complex sp. 280C5]|uniref:biofilm formation regulator BssS n=1 Tax=Enterobacter cloacae complex TaxID=354276 RepID=UPI003CE932C8